MHRHGAAGASALRLHGYWRSTASYRVRIVLNLKGLDYKGITHDLRTGAQNERDYKALNPQGLVPTLVADDGTTLMQSTAIIEWIDETYPNPPLLPTSRAARALVRSMASIVANDIHPLNNLRVLNVLREEFGATDGDVHGWMSRWILSGFSALDTLIGRHGGAFAAGDDPTLADCYLVPQLYSAERFDVDVSAYRHLLAVASRFRELAPVQLAHPDLQPDADV